MEPRHSDNESDEEEAPPAAVAPTAPPPARRAKAAKTNPPCSVCGKVVAGNATHLKMHMNTHTGDRPHACAFEGCGKTFKQSSHLKVHEKMHERPPAAKKPPQQCGVCAKIVAGGPAHLQLHMNVHTGARPYKCNQCSKAFAQPGSLTYHVRRHHSGEKPHRCDVDGCGAAFVSSGELAGHKESHHSAAGAQRKKKQEQAMKNALVLGGYVECFERGRVPAPGEFTREVYFDHRCALARDFKPGEKQFAYVDFVVTSPDGRVVFLEVDEEQHSHQPQLCESTRMWNICQSIMLADLGGDINVFWLRVNPNVGFKVGGKTLRTGREQRFSEVIKFLDNLKSSEADPPMCIGYGFYDCEPNGAPLVLKDPEYHPEVKDAVICISKGSQKLIQPCAFPPINPLFAAVGPSDLTAAAFGENAFDSDDEFEEEVPEGEAGGSSGKRPRVK